MASEIDTLRVAALQMVSGRDVAVNLQQAQGLLHDAASQGAQLVLLPENFALFGCDDWRREGEQEATTLGRIRQFLAEQAQQLDLWIVGGTLPTVAANAQGIAPDTARVFTSSFVVNPQGVEVCRYDKIHLFDVDVADDQGSYRESADFAPGSEPILVTESPVPMGMSVCYDLRFPELYRYLAQLGAQLLVVPAAFTRKTGEAHWQVLLRARAIENQCFVIGANQGGRHSSKRETWGHSCIISPWGDVLAECELGAQVVIADLSFSALRELRQSMPVLHHRRL